MWMISARSLSMLSVVSATLRQVSGLQVPMSGRRVVVALLAESGGVGVDAGDVFVGIDRWIVACDEPAQAAFIGDDGPAEVGALV